MQRDLAAGTDKKVCEVYCQVIERHLIPFFGERHLQTLKHKDIAEGRWLIAKHELLGVLHRLHSRQKDIAGKPFDAVMGRHKAYLFRTSDGRRPYSFSGLFRRLLRHAELLLNAMGETRTLYSLRHTYATAELLNATDIHTLSKQMGTSVSMLELHYSKLIATMAADRLA